MAPPGKMGDRSHTTTVTMADTYTGYDPHSMMWTTISTSDSRPELPQTFKSTALAAAVARRERATRQWRHPRPRLSTRQTTPPPHFRRLRRAPRARNRGGGGPQRSRQRAHRPPRSERELAGHSRDGAGPKPHPGLPLHPLIADKLIGELTVPSSVGPVPLFGYLRADTQDSCYGVVTVRSSDSEAELRQRFYWPEGEILHIRRLGTSNKVRLTFAGKVKPRYVTYDALLIPVQPYRKTVPASNQCGSVGHRPDACPGPKPDLCGTCGNTVPLIDGARAPHECTPKCALCAGPHVTGDRCCKERYRAPPPKPSTLLPKNQTGSKKRKHRRTRKPSRPTTGTSPQGAQPPATKPSPLPPHPGAGASGPSKRGPTPAGPPAVRSTSSQGPPASPTPHPPSPGIQPAA
ncbi:hypothetical protein HPB51_002188 [Rhipicephalus microplus]|uniref:Uncharacterized protein n=1 Tax=Rhipicephalus microplus TaxID=6941 RepID=A0A9J6EKC0_RHIMP|nr:hypothetical protein HPB51_002188 [Rhipicephalus microplus]